MSVGVAAVITLLAAGFQFASDFCYTLGDWAEAPGDPEIPTPILTILFYLVGSGRYGTATLVLLAFALADVGSKELGLQDIIFPGHTI